MKYLLVFVIMILFPACGFCQLALKLEFNRGTYIRYEAIYAKLTIKNMTGHSLVFGNNPKLAGTIKFEFETNAQEPPICIDEKFNPLTDMVFAPGETESVTIPLSKIYRILDDGTYHVKAIITHGQLGMSYQTNVADFKIVSGTLAWETTVGVPTVENNNSKDEQISHRKYMLFSFFDGQKKIYCLRIDDDKFVYGLARLGIDIGVEKPQCMTDRLSRLHVLLQSSPLIFSYYVFDTNCHIEEMDFYKKTEASIPNLIMNKEIGRIEIAGGARAEAGKDYSMEERNK